MHTALMRRPPLSLSLSASPSDASVELTDGAGDGDLATRLRPPRCGFVTGASSSLSAAAAAAADARAAAAAVFLEAKGSFAAGGAGVALSVLRCTRSALVTTRPRDGAAAAAGAMLAAAVLAGVALAGVDFAAGAAAAAVLAAAAGLALAFVAAAAGVSGSEDEATAADFDGLAVLTFLADFGASEDPDVAAVRFRETGAGSSGNGSEVIGRDSRSVNGSGLKVREDLPAFTLRAAGTDSEPDSDIIRFLPVVAASTCPFAYVTRIS